MGSWGEQYSAGEQGDSRRQFWEDDYSKCPRCGGKDIKNTANCAGCRHNGDGYGTEEYECKACGWLTSFQYDESDTPYFYETRFWSKGFGDTRQPRPVKPKTVLTEELRAEYTRMLKHTPPEYVQRAMTMANISEEDAVAFVKANAHGSK